VIPHREAGAFELAAAFRLAGFFAAFGNLIPSSLQLSTATGV
jgi:hypothetical protein